MKDFMYTQRRLPHLSCLQKDRIEAILASENSKTSIIDSCTIFGSLVIFMLTSWILSVLQDEAIAQNALYTLQSAAEHPTAKEILQVRLDNTTRLRVLGF
jgi:hypothetical protein